MAYIYIHLLIFATITSRKRPCYQTTRYNASGHGCNLTTCNTLCNWGHNIYIYYQSLWISVLIKTTVGISNGDKLILTS